MLAILGLLALLLLSNVTSFQFASSNAQLKRAIKGAATAVVAASLLSGSTPFPSFAEVVPELSAAEVIEADVTPKILVLKDILFVLRLYPNLSDQQDYAQLRSSLRSSPLIDLRKTCRKLKPLLAPAAKQIEFQAKYDVMIDSVNYLDVVLLRRTQGENVPKKDAKDTELLAAIEKAANSFEDMLAVAIK